MKVYSISDFHLSNATDKPMDVFGAHWKGHWAKIKDFFQKNITDEDIVLVAGDTSWGMNIPEAQPDLEEIDRLPGKKFIIRGNHDYWWSSYQKINNLGLKTITFIQNNAFKVNDVVICGTRGWTVPDKDSSEEDKKIYDRELIRLRLTLDAAKELKSEGDRLYLMVHYPPFNVKFEDSEMTSVIEEYPVDAVIYGHLHGVVSRSCACVEKKGVPYYLTSCDYINFTPIVIEE